MFISTKKPKYKLNISTAVLHMKCRDPYFFTVFFVGMLMMVSCFCGKRRLPLFPSGAIARDSHHHAPRTGFECAQCSIFMTITQYHQ